MAIYCSQLQAAEVQGLPNKRRAARRHLLQTSLHQDTSVEKDRTPKMIDPRPRPPAQISKLLFSTLSYPLQALTIAGPY